MSDWNEIKRAFRDALIAAFNWHRLGIVLIYHCDRRIDRITSESEGFDQNVDDVIADAEQNGWLEMLAAGALAENERHTGLQVVVPYILQGVEVEGKAYYQGSMHVPDRDSVAQAVRQSAPTRQLKKVLDAALQSEIAVGEETLLLVLIRELDSRGLVAILEIEPEYGLQEEDIRQSRPFKLYFPIDELGNLLPATVEVIIVSPGFDPSQQSKMIEVLPSAQSEDELYPEEFVLTPLRTGTLRVVIEVYQQPQNKRKKIGSKPISTLGLESKSVYAKWKVQSILFSGQDVTSRTIGGVTFSENVDSPLSSYISTGGQEHVGFDQPGQEVDGNLKQASGDTVVEDNITSATGVTTGRGIPPSITIGDIPAADDAAMKTISHLVSQLNDLLILAPADQQSDAAAVVQLTQRLLDSLSADEPDPDLVHDRGSALQQWAQAFSDSVPQVVDLIARITMTAMAIATAAR